MGHATDFETMRGIYSLTFFRSLLAKIQQIVRVLKNTRRHPFLSINSRAYARWIKKNTLTETEVKLMEKEINSFSFKPMFSVITPVYNIEEQYLRRAVESVFNQAYRNWELCIADDASQAPHVKNLLKMYQNRNERIKVKYLEKNLGISGASNEALSLATGQYVVFLDHDDELSRDSLYEVVKVLNEHPEVDIIYTDEDKLTVSSKRLLPVFKPDWDPDLFLTYNYLCHLVVCRRDLVSIVGGFRKGFEGSQDYDLLLRLTEITDNIFHIPKVLYHWRMIPGSAAMKVDAKREAFEKSKQALREAMKRRNIRAKISEGKILGTFKVTKIKNSQ